LKLGRNLNIVFTGIVLCILLVGGLSELWDSGSEEGLSPFYQACYIVSAVGVIWLIWSWQKLSSTITSMAKQLRQSEPAYIKPGDDVVVNSLTEAIIYSIRDAVLVVDEFDKLLMANEAAGKLFNFDFSNSQHKPISELIGQSGTEFVKFLVQSRKGKARAAKREIEFLKGAEPKTYDCIISCVYDQRQKVCGAVAVLHDITREKQIQQMKNDFVSHVSHELKTPLSSITAYSEMLADGEAGDEKEDT